MLGYHRTSRRRIPPEEPLHLSPLGTPPVLFVPGWKNSGPGHWQTLWQASEPGWDRVMQRDWERPGPVAWLAALDERVSECTSRPVLVGHSLGAIAIVKWAAIRRGRAAGAFLVAPADVEAFACPSELRPFAPIPRRPIPFPVHVVASHDDPYVTPVRAAEFARSWGASFTDIGSAGHINIDSGHGPWPEGRVLLDALLARLAARP
jgi:predicted alpha/beta hydrolase family esterase